MTKHRSHTDPEELAISLDRKRPAPELKLVLGLDFGLSTGMAVAWFDPKKPFVIGERPIYAGQLNLAMGEWDNSPARIVRLRAFLETINADLVGFEDVAYTPPGDLHGAPSVNQIVARVAKPIEWFGALKATTVQWGTDRGVPCFGYGIGTIKKRATGKGNANKEQIIAAANEELMVNLDPTDYKASGDDNIADACYVLLLTVEQYARGIRCVPRGPNTAPNNGDG